MDRLKGKIAIITGGSSGIGLETARQFKNEGATVTITGRNSKRLKQATQVLGSNAYSYELDVRSVNEIEEFSDYIKSVYGEIDILFANAGMGNFAPLEEIDQSLYDEQFEINVRGLFFTVQKMVPLVKYGGSIILNASSVSEKGSPHGSIYFASKAAVRSLARSLAAELGPKGIRVNALSPGVVRTNFQASTNIGQEKSEPFITSVVNNAPLKREGTSVEIANAAVFLASDESSYVTAADLIVDGGWRNV